jgi:hypothetical protein
MTIDPRGHGDSRADSIPSYALLPAHHRSRIAADVASGWRYLRDEVGVAPGRIVIVAAGGGCTTVERAIHEHAVTAAVVHLSPTFGADDRELAAALSFRPPAPMLALASDEDAFAVRSLGLLTAARGESGGDASGLTTRVFRFSGHGVELLRDPANFAVVAGWTRTALAIPE